MLQLFNRYSDRKGSHTAVLHKRQQVICAVNIWCEKVSIKFCAVQNTLTWES